MFASSILPIPVNGSSGGLQPLRSPPSHFVSFGDGQKLDFDLPAKGGDTKMAAGAASGGSV